MGAKRDVMLEGIKASIQASALGILPAFPGFTPAALAIPALVLTVADGVAAAVVP